MDKIDINELDPEQMTSLLIDYIDGNLSEELKKFIEARIEKDETVRKEYTQLNAVLTEIDREEELDVDSRSRSLFVDEIRKIKDSESQKEETSNRRFFQWNFVNRVAAGVILLLLGYGVAKIADNSDKEISAMREELAQTRQMIFDAMKNQESASQRIQGVMVTNQLVELDGDIMDALILTMNNDENVNVRLAAIDALSRFMSHETVKSAMIETLLTQENAAVQIQLIEILASSNDPKAKESLQEMANDETKIQSVRDQAQLAVFKL